MGTVKVTNIEPIADNGTLTIGNSGDTVALTSGAKTSGFGKIGQVVSVTNSTEQTTTSTSFVASTGLTASITPTTTTSKILVSVMSNVRSDANDAFYTLYRGSTNLSGSGGFVQIYAGTNDIRQLMTINYVDSPATTSATTYTLYFRAGAGTCRINQESGKQGQIILQEILD